MDEKEKLLIETVQRSKSNAHRVDEIYDELKNFKDEMRTEIKDLKLENKAIYDIATSVKVIATKVESIEEKIDSTNSKVDSVTVKVDGVERRIIEVEDAPAKTAFKNMNSIKVAIITAICTFLVSGAMGAIFLLAK